MKKARKFNKKRIFLTILLIFSSFMIVSGVLIWLVIQSYMNKININLEDGSDAKELEADSYLDNSVERRDFSSLGNYTSETNTCYKDIETTTSDTEDDPMDKEAKVYLEEENIVKEDVITSSLNQGDGNKNANVALEKLSSLVENNTWREAKLMEDKDITNLLFIIISSKDKEENLDNIILLSINQEEKVITSVSFSKSIYLQLSKEKNDSLYSVYLYGGAKLLMKVLQNNFRIKIDRYIITDNASLQKILESIQDDTFSYDNMDQLLNEVLPCITTNLMKKEILSFALKMPTYVNYSQKEYNIPIEKSYETYELEGTMVLGIDFNKNINLLLEYLY